MLQWRAPAVEDQPPRHESQLEEPAFEYLPVLPSNKSAYAPIEPATWSRRRTESLFASMFTPAASWPSKDAPVPPLASRSRPRRLL